MLFSVERLEAGRQNNSRPPHTWNIVLDNCIFPQRNMVKTMVDPCPSHTQNIIIHRYSPSPQKKKKKEKNGIRAKHLPKCQFWSSAWDRALQFLSQMVLPFCPSYTRTLTCMHTHTHTHMHAHTSPRCYLGYYSKETDQPETQCRRPVHDTITSQRSSAHPWNPPYIRRTLNLCALDNWNRDSWPPLNSQS